MCYRVETYYILLQYVLGDICLIFMDKICIPARSESQVYYVKQG